MRETLSGGNLWTEERHLVEDTYSKETPTGRRRDVTEGHLVGVELRPLQLDWLPQQHWREGFMKRTTQNGDGTV